VAPIACTRFCEQPGIETVGGTKNPDIDAITRLAPDVVVVNDEENRREDFDAMVAAGLAVHSMSPRSVHDVGPAVAALAGVVDVPVPRPFGPSAWPEWLDGAAAVVADRRDCVAFVWRRPWMTLAPDTYAASLLWLLGIDHTAWPGPDRYPTVTLSDVAARGPDVVLLPSEPYAFGDKHVAEVEAGAPETDVRLVDGQDLFWWGTRTPAAAERLRVALG
jgi:ABC-type hemin transport system substrate-binding protein